MKCENYVGVLIPKVIEISSFKMMNDMPSKNYPLENKLPQFPLFLTGLWMLWGSNQILSQFSHLSEDLLHGKHFNEYFHGNTRANYTELNHMQVISRRHQINQKFDTQNWINWLATQFPKFSALWNETPKNSQ